MSIVHFNKATEPANVEDLWVNVAAVRYVEPTPYDQLGKTLLFLVGAGETGVAVIEPLAKVLESIGRLVETPRHYLGNQPEHGAGMVYVAPALISYLRPNTQGDTSYWYVHFVDGSELRIRHPIPAGFE
jgi:hypothetical protein